MWELTTLTRRAARLRGPASHQVDSGGGILKDGDHTVPLTMRARSLVELLSWAKQGELAGQHSGWVRLDDIATLPEWAGDRLGTSLRSQVRREIKGLADGDFDLIETPARKLLGGPFRLRQSLKLPASVSDHLDRRFGAWRDRPIRPMDLVMRLEDAEWVWRRGFLFDKEDEILSDNIDLNEPVHEAGPMLGTMGFIDRARRLREIGKLRESHTALDAALEAIEGETNHHVRSNLRASCHFQRGWLLRIEKRYKEAEAAIEEALGALDGEGHLKVLGQILSLRALLRAREGKYDEALQDFRLAGDYWLIEGDLYNLFSVYHNVGYILIKQADRADDDPHREKLLRDAIFCCAKSETYCRKFKVGQNSVVSLIQLAALHTRVGEFDKALGYADRAFHDAQKKENEAQARAAHKWRAGLMLLRHDLPGAEAIQKDFVDSMPARARVLSRDFDEVRRSMTALMRKSGSDGEEAHGILAKLMAPGSA